MTIIGFSLLGNVNSPHVSTKFLIFVKTLKRLVCNSEIVR